MGIALPIKDESLTGECLSQAVLTFPVAQITVRQLIEARVEHEIAHRAVTSVVQKEGQFQPDPVESLLNGPRLLDDEQQKLAAICAFQGHAFFLFVNDRQMTSLKDEILITSNTRVLFIKLVPLVGG